MILNPGHYVSLADVVNLFEYQNKETLSQPILELEEFLDTIWAQREKYSQYAEDNQTKIESQRFIQFLHNSGEIKSNKYVGVIHFKDIKINLLPKIFYDPSVSYSESQINNIHNHILWWLSYCRKIKFPNYKTALSGLKSDFFEVLIYLFSKYTKELLSSAVYQQFENMEGELPFIKGKLNTSTYITESVSKGRWHKLNCSYDAFILDNEFNRIIKYVSALLFGVTKVQDNKKNLREILFILDEVTEVRATAQQCRKITFNPFLSEFETVRDFCHLFLANYISFDYKNDLKLFAFLLPMEYVFEDFVFGFINKELPEISSRSQITDTYLDESKSFNLVPDLFIKSGQRSFIADTKYKIVYSDATDPKKGISQADLYQLIAYAVRFNVETLILFYPITVLTDQDNSTEFHIKDKLAGDTQITVSVFQIPIINKDLLQIDIDMNSTLENLFESTTEKLRIYLRKIFADYALFASSCRI